MSKPRQEEKPQIKVKQTPRTRTCKRSCTSQCQCSDTAEVLWHGQDMPVTTMECSNVVIDEGPLPKPPAPVDVPRHNGTFEKDNELSMSKMAMGLWERRSQISSATVPRWERVVLTVDSGASDTVIPPGVCSLAVLHHTEKVGTEYEVANGGIIENLGERRCLMRLSEKGNVLDMKRQVVDVHKPLLAVSKLVEAGHEVVFKPDGGYIQIKGGDRLPLRKSGGVYELEVWLKSAEPGEPGFSRPS